MHVFELHDLRGTIVGMRFPDHAGGIEAGGYHLHFIDAERRRGPLSTAAAPTYTARSRK